MTRRESAKKDKEHVCSKDSVVSRRPLYMYQKSIRANLLIAHVFIFFIYFLAVNGYSVTDSFND